MAAAPSHYIRTIHTSFTAAHPRNAHSSTAAWAARSQAPILHTPLTHQQKDREMHTQAARELNNQYNQLHYQALQHNQYQVQPSYSQSISTHNHHNYTHHLQALNALHGQGGYPQQSYSQQGQAPASVVRRKPSGGLANTAGGLAAGPAGSGGRRRSASIRMPPSYVAPAARGRAPTQGYKFDPFADDEAPVSGGTPLSVTNPLMGSSQSNRSVRNAEREDPAVQRYNTAPYTIHIPAAQPTEIQQYTPPPSPRPAARTATLRSLIPINGPLPGTAPTSTATSHTLARSPSPPTAMNTLSRSPSPPSSRPVSSQPRPMQQTPPNLSKIVAGILLNRVHAVGKPMRRRVLPRASEGEKGYRKSCLSSVINIEA